jgi:hypothetical protein
VTGSFQRTAKRDMAPSGIAKILELFFAGNQFVQAAVLFDKTGETIDYHSVLDPFETRLTAAYCGILFEATRYKMLWLEHATLELLEFSTQKYDFVTAPLLDDFFLTLQVRAGAVDETLLDTISGAKEALLGEIG